MNILVIGSGGREHALIWKIRQSPKVRTIYCANGNGGTATLAENVPIKPESVLELAEFAMSHGIDLTVVGSELPLTLGIVDEFRKRGLKIFGPSSKAAAIEGSKVFAKDLMKKYSIPTAAYETFSDIEKAKAYILKNDRSCVVKADGLAAGKGAIVCMTTGEAIEAVNAIMSDGGFGTAGKHIVIEEFMAGEEASVFAITDGKDYIVLPAAQDHKRAYDGDLGKNTGGMGAYAPAPVVTETVLQRAKREIIEPTIAAMQKEGCPFQGVLYCGLMITSEGPKVVEFNCRFGDPECQVLMPLIKSDVVDLFLAVDGANLKSYSLEIHDASAVCIVMASGGYPDAYEKGKLIRGLRTNGSDTVVFHAGTEIKNGDLVSSGGRVLGITAWAGHLPEALQLAYTAVKEIHFDGSFYRSDIGHRALKK